MTSFSIEALRSWRAARDHRFKTHYTSPIPEEHLDSFAGLDYFEPAPSLVMEGSFTPAGGKVEIKSSTGGNTAYHLAGHLELALDDGICRLIVPRGEEGEIYIPFRDRTSGSSSYGGGRYVFVDVDEHFTAVVDFNRAVDPFCAYDEEFSCPLPPPDNWLPTAIRGGEEDYRPVSR
jgi:uncharacterized protein (DUF1684 family)